MYNDILVRIKININFAKGICIFLVIERKGNFKSTKGTLKSFVRIFNRGLVIVVLNF